jgi:hypothetical protein
MSHAMAASFEMAQTKAVAPPATLIAGVNQ